MEKKMRNDSGQTDHRATRSSETHVKHQEWKVIDSTENVSVQRSILRVNPKGPIQ
jgi:hypothetical protein